jgi:Flp pilus assembly protein TadD
MKVILSLLAVLFYLNTYAQVPCLSDARGAYNKHVVTQTFASLQQAEKAVNACNEDPAAKTDIQFLILKGAFYEQKFVYSFNETLKTVPGETKEEKEAYAYAQVYPGDLELMIEALKQAEKLDVKKAWENEIKGDFYDAFEKAYLVAAYTEQLGDYKTAGKFAHLAAYSYQRSGQSYDKDVIVLAARATYNSEDWKLASEYYRVMIANKWGTETSTAELANAQFMADNFPSALYTIEHGLADDKDNTALLLTRAKVYHKQGRTAFAKNELKSMVEEEPKNANMLTAYARFLEYIAFPYNDKGEDLPKPADFMELVKQAESTYEKVIEHGDTADFYTYYYPAVLCNNYAAHLYENRDVKDAQSNYEAYSTKSLNYFSKAYNINPKHRTTVKALANLFGRSGNTEMAERMERELEALK